ncbi:PaaI family thioesterase [Streptomyces sulfonofaciens]|nr:PaaI family thioesterase [Streptomyces sulfonofaciens]
MTERSGPLWDPVLGRAPLPRAAATLGFELLDADAEEGTVEVAFTATADFTNPLGNVLGGFLAAMLHDTVGTALLATVGPGRFQSTEELTVRFLRPVRPGRLVGTGHVVHRDEDHASLEAALSDPTGAIVATATALARIVDLDAGGTAP